MLNLPTSSVNILFWKRVLNVGSEKFGVPLIHWGCQTVSLDSQQLQWSCTPDSSFFFFFFFKKRKIHENINSNFSEHSCSIIHLSAFDRHLKHNLLNAPLPAERQTYEEAIAQHRNSVSNYVVGEKKKKKSRRAFSDNHLPRATFTGNRWHLNTPLQPCLSFSQIWKWCVDRHLHFH